MQNRRPMQIKRNLQQDARQGTRKDREKMQTSCDTCANYEYDDDEEYYTCAINLDEDEMYRFLSGSKFECPYYTTGDEYAVVRHQM